MNSLNEPPALYPALAPAHYKPGYDASEPLAEALERLRALRDANSTTYPPEQIDICISEIEVVRLRLLEPLQRHLDSLDPETNDA